MDSKELELKDLKLAVEDMEHAYVNVDSKGLLEFVLRAIEIADQLRQDEYYDTVGRELALVQTNLDYIRLWATGRTKSNLYGDVVRQRIANCILWAEESVTKFSQPPVM